MILKSGDELPETVIINVHTEKKIKRKTKVLVGLVSIVTEPEDKIYMISFFKRRQLTTERPSSSDVNSMCSFRRGVAL